MKRLLYLQNSKVRQSVAKLDERFESWGLNVDRYWAYEGSFPESLSRYDGIFLSGSPHGAYEDIPFIHREHELIQGAAETGIPMLGICFGHQILASALCGRNQIFRRQTCEVGYRWLDVKPGAVDDSMAQELEKDGAVIDDLNRTADAAVTVKTMLTRFTDIVSGRSG